MKTIRIKNFSVGPSQPFCVIAGPCVIESEKDALFAAEALKKIFNSHGINFIYKSSYDKANRSSASSYRGPGLEKGLKILEKVRAEFDLPIFTDVHTPEEARIAGQLCDVIQIPAFLCRQTDLLLAAAETPAVINIKKGQFMSPWEMKNAVEKVESKNHHRILLTDRGTSFGYNNLVSDMRAIPIMQKFGYPVCFDAAHSCQLPGGLGHQTNGQREFIPTLSKAALAAGADLLYIESHPHPDKAKSDPFSMLSFEDLSQLLFQLKPLYDLVHV